MNNLIGVLTREGEPFMQVVLTVERNEDGKYTAFCDELRCVADGATEEEALSNLKDAIVVLFEEYGDEIRANARPRRHEIITV